MRFFFPRRRCISLSVRCIPLPSSFCLSLSPFSLSDDWWAAAALSQVQVLRLSLVSSPATSTHQVLPPLLFPSLMLCEAEHRNPNLKLFSYLTRLLTSKFLQKLSGVHVYTHVPLLDPPLLGSTRPFNFSGNEDRWASRFDPLHLFFKDCLRAEVCKQSNRPESSK